MSFGLKYSALSHVPLEPGSTSWTLTKPRKPEAGTGAAGRSRARGISGRPAAPEMLREVPAQGISENRSPERSQAGLGPGLGALRPGAASPESSRGLPVPESLAE